MHKLIRTRWLAGGLAWVGLAGCGAPETAHLGVRDQAAASQAVDALLQLPAFTGSEGQRGFCLGLKQSQAGETLAPEDALLAQVGRPAVPLFPYSACEPPAPRSFGDVRLSGSGARVGLIVLSPVQWGADGVAHVALRVDGGAFAAAGFACTVSQAAGATCTLTWIS